MNVETGKEAVLFISGNICFEFSVQWRGGGNYLETMPYRCPEEEEGGESAPCRSLSLGLLNNALPTVEFQYLRTFTTTRKAPLQSPIPPYIYVTNLSQSIEKISINPVTKRLSS
jgi:hypothetical protein